MKSKTIQESLGNRLGLGAFAIYLALSFLFFGRGLVGHLSDRYIGIGTDPGLFIFFLEWWKYAILHRLNPFFTNIVWAPSGLNLARTTFVPLAGILASPLTEYLGPLATYNLMILVSPAIAAWTGFTVCRYLSSSSRSAFVGGYIFGFSPYMLGQMLGHLHALMVFAIPIILMVILLRIDGIWPSRRFIIMLCLLLTIQATCSLEVFATATVFGWAAFAIGYWIAPQWRDRLIVLIFPISFAYIITAVLLSLYLYYFFVFGPQDFPTGLATAVSIHVSGMFFPSPTNCFGTSLFARKLCGGFNLQETGAYVAFPLILIVWSYSRRHWMVAQTRLLLALLIIILLASLGPILRITTHLTIPMPWTILSRLPLSDEVLPARFALYAFLILAIIASLWLADKTIQPTVRIAGAIAIILCYLPNPSAAFWTTDVDTPAFFATDMYKQYLSPGEIVLMLPYGDEGNSDIWLVNTHLYFRMAGGWVSVTPLPREFARYAITDSLYNLTVIPHSDEALKTFLVQKHISKVIVADEGAHMWRLVFDQGPPTTERSHFEPDEKRAINATFASLALNPIKVGGVSIYEVPLSRLSSYISHDPRKEEEAVATERLDALINAASEYTARGLSPAGLSPSEVQRLGLLPPLWVSGVSIYDRATPAQNGMVLESFNDRQILIGVLSSREVVERLATVYRTLVKRVEISPPRSISTSSPDARKWILLMVIDRDQLPGLAELVRSRAVGERNPPTYIR